MLARMISFAAAGILLCGCASTRNVSVKRAYADPMGTVPRMVFLPEVENFRDLGGWRGQDGRTVRQGMVYRSGCLNERWRWYRIGASSEFLSDETRRFLVDELGIRTEIDLRKTVNCRGMGGSPLGPSVKFVNISSKAYGDMASSEGRNAFREVFRVFLQAENYPIVFHCVGGNDRTGAVAFILNGLLGVSEADLRKEWELSRVWNGREDFTYEKRLVRLVSVFDAYEGKTLNERIQGYIMSLGFSAEDIELFRKLMLQETPRAGKEAPRIITCT